MGYLLKLNKWFFAQVPIQKFTLDLDSTVCTRYGEQEGSVKGYNPNKRGRNSHHPIIAFLADIRMVANARLRSGNTSSANNVNAFFEETLNILGSERIGLIRADSGFFDGKFLNLVESRLLKYVVAVKMNALLKNSVLNHNSWLAIDDGIEVGEFTYRAGCWKQERRELIDNQDDGHSIRQQHLWAGINRSTWYYDPVPLSERDKTLMDLLDEQYTKTPFYGVRNMTLSMRAQGFTVGKDHVRTLLRKMGLTAVFPKPNLSKPHPENRIYPYLLRDMEIVH